MSRRRRDGAAAVDEQRARDNEAAGVAPRRRRGIAGAERYGARAVVAADQRQRRGQRARIAGGDLAADDGGDEHARAVAGGAGHDLALERDGDDGVAAVAAEEVDARRAAVGDDEGESVVERGGADERAVVDEAIVARAVVTDEPRVHAAAVAPR